MDYEKEYTDALLRAKQAIKDCSHNEGQKKMIEGIFPELASKEEKIRKELIRLLNVMTDGIVENYTTTPLRDFIAWLEKQGEQKPDWNEYDMVVIDAIYNTLKHSNVTKCGVEVTEMLEWLEELEKQGKRNSADPFLNWLEKQGEQNNLVEQLTAFAQHLNKRGAFREDLCMDLEHEAQSLIEMQNNKE